VVLGTAVNAMCQEKHLVRHFRHARNRFGSTALANTELHDKLYKTAA
jgi:hypothetical protein